MTTPTDEVPEVKTWQGENVRIDLYQDGDVLVYAMTGQGIAPQFDARRMTEDELLAVLLEPMCLVAKSEELPSRIIRYIEQDEE